MAIRLSRRRDYDKVRVNIVRQHKEGFTLETIAVCNRCTVPQARAVIWAAGSPVVKPVSQDPIGFHFQTVKPYICAKCQKRNGIVPSKTTLKPCVKCLAEEKK